MAPANGAAERSATVSISIMRARSCRNGLSPRWTKPVRISRPLCTNASSRSIEAASRSDQSPVLLLSGDKSRIASEQQKILADTLPHGRLELFAGYGHGVNLLQPERCARAALDFWRAVEAEDK